MRSADAFLGRRFSSKMAGSQRQAPKATFEASGARCFALSLHGSAAEPGVMIGRF